MGEKRGNLEWQTAGAGRSTGSFSASGYRVVLIKQTIAVVFNETGQVFLLKTEKMRENHSPVLTFELALMVW
jgi:NADPH-dependent glutamate synthase beta subunit-like oxidoreductase